MTGDQLGWGIVGLGRLADQSIAPAMRAASNGRLVACCSRDLARANAFAERHGAARAYDSYEAMVANPEVQAVFIATPNALHVGPTIAAARAGKHVLCEKPLALTVADANTMIEACARAGVTLGIGLHLRFEPFYQRLRTLIQGGAIGRCVEVSLQRCSPPGHVPHDPDNWRRKRALAGLGVLYDMGPHVFDVLCWILGAEPRRLAAFVQPPWQSGQPDDRAVSVIELDNGCLATVRLLRDLPQTSDDFAFYGDAGAIVTGALRGVQTLRLTRRTAKGTEDESMPIGKPYLGEIEHFPRQIAGESAPAASIADALRTVRVSEAIVASLERGAVVDVPL